MGRLENKVAIVTGGGSGIGRSTSLLMAREGAAVMVAGRHRENIERVAQEITESGGRALSIKTDVGVVEEVEQMVVATVEAFGGVDILHNNAAAVSKDETSQDTDVVHIDLELWDLIMRVNLRGPMLGCRFAIPFMIKRGGGSIINTSSLAAEYGDLGRTAYAASKGGVNALTKTVATIYGRNRIRCNSVLPGPVLTPAIRAARTPAMVDEWESHELMPGIPEPGNIAHMVAFLASDEAISITGQNIPVDGGLMSHYPIYAYIRAQGA